MAFVSPSRVEVDAVCHPRTLVRETVAERTATIGEQDKELGITVAGQDETVFSQVGL